MNSTDYLEYTLQDANYNVVANVMDYGGAEVTYQYRYDPYGGWSTFERGSDGLDLSFSPSDQYIPHVHSANGLYFDQETGMIYNRGRYRKVS